MKLVDIYRSHDMRVNVDNLLHMQDAQIAAGFQKKRIDPRDFVDLSYLPH
jgi:hypothetical protein